MDKSTRPKVIDAARLRLRAVGLAAEQVAGFALGKTPGPTRAFDNILFYECAEEHRDIVHDVYNISVNSRFLRLYVIARYEDGPQICDFTIQIYVNDFGEGQPCTIVSGRMFM